MNMWDCTCKNLFDMPTYLIIVTSVLPQYIHLTFKYKQITKGGGGGSVVRGLVGAELSHFVAHMLHRKDYLKGKGEGGTFNISAGF